MKKNHTSAIIQRFHLLMEEVINEGSCRTKAEFFAEIGEHPRNISNLENGTMQPTLEQLAIACERYSYSPTWLILNHGPKKMMLAGKKPLDQRLSELEMQVRALKQQVKLNPIGKKDG